MTSTARSLHASEQRPKVRGGRFVRYSFGDEKTVRRVRVFECIFVRGRRGKRITTVENRFLVFAAITIRVWWWFFGVRWSDVVRLAVRRRKKRFVFRPLCRDEYLSRDRRPGETAGSGWRGGPLLIFSFLFLCFCVFFVYCRHEVTEEI